MSDNKVKIAVRVRDSEGELLPQEWLWATVVQEDVRKGIYCLLNTPFWAPFALGDLVEARIQRNGDRVVTALHRRGGRTAHMLVWPVDADKVAIQRLAEQWSATGTWVEGCCGGTVLTVSVEPAAGAEPTKDQLAELVASGRLDDLRLIADPDDTPGDPIFRDMVAA